MSGGSAINLAVKTARLLDASRTQNLTVGLVDERYGPAGHRDSNWQQLKKAGFKMDKVRPMPVLNGLGPEVSAAEYNNFIRSILDQGYFILGLLGMGADGHTAGILPGSPAVSSSKFVDYYTASDFARITLTAKGLSVIHKAVVYAEGEAKKGALEDLTRSLPPAKQPAQLLKAIADVDVYNNVIGDEI